MLRPFAWPSTAPAAVGDTAVSAGGAATPTRLRRLRWRAELAGYRLLVALLHALGHGSALYLGESVGRLIPWVAPRRRRIALAAGTLAP